MDIPIIKEDEIIKESNYFEKAKRYQHSDITSSGQSEAFMMSVEGELIPYMCVKGYVDTKSKKLSNYLSNLGFRFIRDLNDEDFDEYDEEDINEYGNE